VHLLTLNEKEDDLNSHESEIASSMLSCLQIPNMGHVTLGVTDRVTPGGKS
jgi:hypothetical protein